MPRRQWIEFAAVRDALHFPDVLSHYDIAHPSGRNQVKVICPFHEESTASCSINNEKGIFQCFGCQTKGSVLEFIVRMENGDPANAEDLHAGALVGIDIMGASPDDFGRTPKKKGAAKERAKPKQKPEPEGTDTTPNKVLDLELSLDPTHAFLQNRGIEPDVAERFGMGFCTTGIMRNRIAIPLHNAVGELLAFVGRYAADKIPKDTERYKFPKGFKKGLELFNLHRALTLKKRYVLLVEGYWSAIRLHEMGIPVVALMGTSVSQQQAQLLRDHGIKFAILMLDGDDPGREAAPAATHVLSQHVYVRSVDLQDGQKPDSVDPQFLERFL